jgi:hypothetical protein
LWANSVPARPRFPLAARLSLLALLAVAAYAPTLSLPLIEDDYPNLAQSLKFDSLGGLASVLGDAVFRLRATSYWVMYGMWQLFHLTPVAYHIFSLLLHIAATFLVYALWSRVSGNRTVALFAAGFFAVAEGHQEAVMWFSAINELLMFVFGMAALLLWVIAESSPGRTVGLRIGSLCLFALALLSKESAVIFLPLLLLVAPRDQWRGAAVRLLPYAVLAAAAVASVLAARTYSFRFSDGSFSLSAPFWMILPRNVFRVLWIWGLLALPVAFLSRPLRGPAIFALVWIGIGLLPYSFLTYSTQIPSRQTYLASAGLALLFGMAVNALRPRWLVAAVLVIALLHNVGYLWIRKRAQFAQRAAPTEQLIRLARSTTGPIWMRCFPRVPLIADEAVHMAAGRPLGTLIWNDADAAARRPTAEFCYSGESAKSSR